MGSTELLEVGKIRWFDTTQQCGVVAAITGTGLFFERPEGDDCALAAGELVTYVHPGAGHPNHLATDVRPLEPDPVALPLVVAEEPQPAPRSKRFARPWRTSAPALHGA